MLAELLDTGPRHHLSLTEVIERAPALTRVDRKYVVRVPVAKRMLDLLCPSWGVLVVNGRSTTHYRSTYFDNPDFATARMHVQGRRRRWKARSRLYVEDHLCRTEVKAKDGRGHTVKTIVDSPADGYGRLTGHTRAFLHQTLTGHSIKFDIQDLQPSIEVNYERMTLASVDEVPMRLTVDWGVSCRLGSETVWVDHDHVLVETKGGLQQGDADRLLARLGARPRGFSKYAAAASVLHDDISDNDVRRLRGTVLRSGSIDIKSTSA